MVYVLGGDISHWNEPDFRQLWEEGYRFLYIKISEGTNWTDPSWKAHVAIATSIGFKVGPFHYFLPMLNGTAQAGYFYSEAQSQIWDMPPMIDVEEPQVYAWTGTKEVYAARIKACLGEVYSLFGWRGIVYTSKYKWDTYVDTYVEEDLMVAHWTARDQPLIPVKWEGRGWKIWQYKITPIDTDRFNGSGEDFLRWLGEDVPPVPGDLEERIIVLEDKVDKIIAWAQSFGG